ncbi:MAG: N-acetyltransferase, partial [Sphingobacteriales bacterium]
MNISSMASRFAKQETCFTRSSNSCKIQSIFMSLVICRQVDFSTPAYENTVALRYDVLRKPLGLNFTKEQLQQEANDFHLAAYMDEDLAACLILTVADTYEIKMRQVAVKDGLQGKGIGKKLVQFAENFAVEKGFRLMTLHARETAVAFYLSMQYKTKGQPFT